MKGDFSRFTFNKKKHYSGVLMQQGRVQVDADWNEQLAINRYHLETEAGEVIGLQGVPKDFAGGGFKIGVTGDAKNLKISAGRIYVGGKLCENETDGLLLDKQPDLPYKNGQQFAGSSFPEESGTYLVYLDVWQRLITSLEDPDIKESALGGPDTTTREKTVWQVKLLKTTNTACADFTEDWVPPESDSTGMLKATIKQSEDEETPCSLPGLPGYTGLENQLYRVEVHREGSKEQATFKWSRENGSVVTAIKNKSGQVLEVDNVRKDESLGFTGGQWAELIDDRMQLNEPLIPNRPRGQLVLIESINPDTNEVTIKLPTALNPPHPELDSDMNPRLRRWDQTGPVEGNVNLEHGVPMQQTPIELEKGIFIEFLDGVYQAGDYWLIPARSSIKNDAGFIDWPHENNSPVAMPPVGIKHHYCTLALVNFNAATGQFTLPENSDCRKKFPALNAITADDVSFDNSTCSLPGAETVQEAIDLLCQNKRGSCTITPTPGKGWEKILEHIPENQDVKICFQPGTYTLDNTIELEKKGNIQIFGCGQGTRILAPKREAVFKFSNCKSVTIQDIYVKSGVAGKDREKQDLNGALTFIDCEIVHVERAYLKCAADTGRNAACITVRNDDSYPDITASRGFVRIRRCNMNIGHNQIGVLIANAERSHVEDNVLRVTKKPKHLEMKRLVLEKKNRSLIRKTLVSGAVLSKKAPAKKTNVSLSYGGHNIYFNTDKSVAKKWTKLVDENPPKMVRSGKDLLAHISKLADQLIMDKNLIEKYNFTPWYNEFLKGYFESASQGIVIGGSVAPDVRILNNTIYGAMQGIHVGVSHRGSAASPYDSAGTVTVSGNRMDILLPADIDRERHGIFVGNCDSIIIENNYIKVKRFKTNVDGIRVHGYLGRMLMISQNHIVNATTGIYVKPLNNTTTPLWVVSYNMLPESSKQVDAPGNVKKFHNYA